jgi:hypothetical protein
LYFEQEFIWIHKGYTDSLWIFKFNCRVLLWAEKLGLMQAMGASLQAGAVGS